MSLPLSKSPLSLSYTTPPFPVRASCLPRAHNPGVRSRFPTAILFEDYNVSELLQIAHSFLGKQHLRLTDEAEELLTKKFAAMLATKDKQNGNGRAVRNMVEQAMRSQALRLAEDKATMRPSELSLLSAADFL